MATANRLQGPIEEVVTCIRDILCKRRHDAGRPAAHPRLRPVPSRRLGIGHGKYIVSYGCLAQLEACKGTMCTIRRGNSRS